MIVYGKVTHDIFHSADGLYHIFNIRRHGGNLWWPRTREMLHLSH